MSYWGSRSYVSASGEGQDVYGGAQPQQYEANGGGKKRSTSRLKKSSSSSKKAGDDDGGYDSTYTAANNNGGDDNRYNTNGGAGRYNGGGGNGYGGGAVAAPYYGGGGGGYGYGHGGGGDGSAGGYGLPFNAPAAFWVPQEGSRSPMFIHTKEVHVHGVPGYDNEGYANRGEQQGRRGGGGFFGPAFHAVGHFFDRKFGFHDRD